MRGAGPAPKAFWLSAFYLLMLVGAVAVFLLIRHYGETLQAPDSTDEVAAVRSGAGAGGSAFFHVLLALTAVTITGWVLGRALRRVGQPAVIGEVLAGILLGPSLLGRLSPAAAVYVLPPSVAPFLGAIAQLGIVLYMFLVGLQLNGSLLRKRAQITVAISHTSIVMPFLLGALLALLLYPRLSSRDVSFTSFALFLGIAMSITAFPVLARILTDRQMHTSQLGVTALTCASVDDVTAWCLLAFVVGVAQATVGSAVVTTALALGYVGFMFVVARPLVSRVLARHDDRAMTRGMMAGVLVAVLLSALITEAIGVHAIFGAFLLGAVIPHDSNLARAFVNKLEDLVTVLFLPAFFAFTGMRTEIGLVHGWEQWWICALIILVATAGKFGGTLAAARLAGLDWRQSAALGVLMNTRGLMELIVLNIGLDLGVLSPTLFTMMVLMALVTTLATTPILQVLTLHADIESKSNDNPTAPVGFG